MLPARGTIDHLVREWIALRHQRRKSRGNEAGQQSGPQRGMFFFDSAACESRTRGASVG
jgi:hypothetical protein